MAWLQTGIRTLSVSFAPGEVRLLLARSSPGCLCVEGAVVEPWSYSSWADFLPEHYSELAELLAAKRIAMGATDAHVRICLPADAAFFRVWDFPFHSRGKIRRAVSLLQETELPFDPLELELRLLPAQKVGATYYVLAVGMQKACLDALTEALKRSGIAPQLITIQPFPLCNLFPGDSPLTGQPRSSVSCPDGQFSLLRRMVEKIRLSATAAPLLADVLLVHCQGGMLTLAFADKKGRLRSILASDIRPAMELDGVTELTARLLHDVRVLLSCKGDAPQSIFVAGDAHLCMQLLPALTDATGLPGYVFDQAQLPFSLDFAAHVSKVTKEQIGDICEWAPALGLSRGTSLFEQGVSVFFKSCGVSREIPNFVVPEDPSSREGLAQLLRSGWGQISLWLLAVAISWIWGVWAETQRLQTEAEELTRRMRQDFQQAFPQLAARRFGASRMEAVFANRISVLQLDSVGELQEQGVLDLMRSIHDAIPASVEVLLESVVVDKQRVVVTGRALEFSGVEQFRVALAGISGLGEVRIISATVQKDQGRVRFELEAMRGAGQ